MKYNYLVVDRKTGNILDAYFNVRNAEVAAEFFRQHGYLSAYAVSSVMYYNK